MSYGGALYFGIGNELMKTKGATAKVVEHFRPTQSNPKSPGPSTI